MKAKQLKVGDYFYLKFGGYYAKEVIRKPRDINDKFLMALDDTPQSETTEWAKHQVVAIGKKTLRDMDDYVKQTHWLEKDGRIHAKRTTTQQWRWTIVEKDEEVIPATRASYQFLTKKEATKLKRKVKDSKVYVNVFVK